MAGAEKLCQSDWESDQYTEDEDEGEEWTAHKIASGLGSVEKVLETRKKTWKSTKVNDRCIFKSEPMLTRQ